MPCHICDEPTVKSHILPKALAHDVKRGAGHVITGSRWHKGAKPSAGGRFSDSILCSTHEGITSGLDTYGTKFVREVRAAYAANRTAMSVVAANPQPQKLARFALSLIWRESHDSRDTDHHLNLGRYDEAVTDAVFGRGELNWPMMVSQTRYHLGSPDPMLFSLHPFRTKLMELNAWTFTLTGVAFYLVSDNRGTPRLPNYLRANQANPATVIVNDPQDFRTVGILQEILENMRKRGR